MAGFMWFVIFMLIMAGVAFDNGDKMVAFTTLLILAVVITILFGAPVWFGG